MSVTRDFPVSRPTDFTRSSLMKLNYPRTFLLGFGFFGVSVLWAVYNAFVPIFLSERFHLEPGIIGVIMTLDNIAALFIQPPIGAFSDQLRTPIGRRMPFILVGAPIAAIAFALVPVAQALVLFMVSIITMLLAMAVFRTPVIALMPDITPSALRSQANGVINFMGGVGAIIAFLAGSKLYKLSPAFPFWIGSALIVIASLLVLVFIREPKEYEAVPEKEAGVLRNLQIIAADRDRSALRLLLAIFFWFLGYTAIEAFFTLYGTNHLGLDASEATLQLAYLSLFFVLAAIPSGLIAARIGRRVTISAGIILLGVLLMTIFILPPAVLTIALTKVPLLGSVRVISVLLMVGGVAWALININSLPMVVDAAPQDRLGTYTGLYYFFSTLSAIVGPISNGWVVQLTGNNYNTVMLLGPVFLLVALVCMLGVQKGEALAASPVG
jgi:maltose/moltooligosaccharide transporter